MAGFFQDVLKGFLGSDYLKDYKHAGKSFRANGYELAPRFKFLFHVYFNLNVTQIPDLRQSFGDMDQGKLGLLVKNVTLPNYTIGVEEFNQYNRKRLVQQNINYEPVTIDFHDDNGDLMRNLWFKYFQYYYKDPQQPYGTVQANNAGSLNAPPVLGGDYNTRDIYSENRAGNDWGYSAEDTTGSGNKPAFFKDITIFGFNQHNYASYTLINPVITEFKHDQYDYAQGGDTMTNSMTIKYETVKYGAGAMNQDGSPVPGFAQPGYYDTEPSSLSRPGSNNSILGPGGLLDAGVGVFEDLSQGNVLGAVIKGARVYDIIDKGDVTTEGAKEEVLGVILRDGLPAVASGTFNFATPPSTPPKTNLQTNTPTTSTQPSQSTQIISNGQVVNVGPNL